MRAEVAATAASMWRGEGKSPLRVTTRRPRRLLGSWSTRRLNRPPGRLRKVTPCRWTASVSSWSVGNLGGRMASLAPCSRLCQISMVEAAKENAACCRKQSSWVIRSSSLCSASGERPRCAIRTPLGFPVEPEVNMMNAAFSASSHRSTASAGHCAASAISSSATTVRARSPNRSAASASRRTTRCAPDSSTTRRTTADGCAGLSGTTQPPAFSTNRSAERPRWRPTAAPGVTPRRPRACAARLERRSSSA